jgi:hypothetical protein
MLAEERTRDTAPGVAGTHAGSILPHRHRRTPETLGLLPVVEQPRRLCLVRSSGSSSIARCTERASTSSAEDYLANLATKSATHALGTARSADFLVRVRHRLESLGSPDLTATFVGFLTVGRRTGTGDANLTG